MKLIPEARSWYRMFSVQALAFVAAMQGVLAVVPAELLLSHVPFAAAFTWRDVGVALTILAAVLGAIGRVVDQGVATEGEK